MSDLNRPTSSTGIPPPPAPPTSSAPTAPTPVPNSQPPSSPLRPFTAPLPIITDNTTGTTSHPRVFYIFSDDEAPTLPSALSTIHDLTPSTPHMFDRALIVDLAPSDAPTGWVVTSASCMTPDWAVTNAALLPIGGATTTPMVGLGTSPSSITGTSPAAGAGAGAGASVREEDDNEGYTVLQIAGTEVSTAPSSRVLRVPQKAESRDREPMDIAGNDYSALIAEFNERMSGLQMLAEAGKWSLERYQFLEPREVGVREREDEEEEKGDDDV